MKRIVLVLAFSIMSFAVFSQKTFIDYRDSTVYRTVTIGNQTWMAENVRYLPQADSSKKIDEDNMFAPKYFVYGYLGNDLKEAKSQPEYATYGVLYNRAAAETACPFGWHLPSESEWKTLERFVGLKGAELKEVGYRGADQGSRLSGKSELWNDDRIWSSYAFGSLGFDALPGGYRGREGNFHDKGMMANFWSRSDYSDGETYYRAFQSTTTMIYRQHCSYGNAMSVRCISDF